MSRRYSPQEREEIMAESRRLLEEFETAPNYEPAPEDALTRWRREQQELEARRAREREREEARQSEIARQQQVRTMKSDAGWNKWADDKIKAALAEFARDLEKKLGQVVGHEQELVRDHVAEQIQKLRADLRQEIAVAKAAGDGTLIDITPAKKRTDAA
jgi:hypothetical protein